MKSAIKTFFLKLPKNIFEWNRTCKALQLIQKSQKSSKVKFKTLRWQTNPLKNVSFIFRYKLNDSTQSQPIRFDGLMLLADLGTKRKIFTSPRGEARADDPNWEGWPGGFGCKLFTFHRLANGQVLAALASTRISRPGGRLSILALISTPWLVHPELRRTRRGESYESRERFSRVFLEFWLLWFEGVLEES